MPELIPHEHAVQAFAKAMAWWEDEKANGKRPDMDERARVIGALLAYQRGLDACILRGKLPQPDSV